MKIAIITAGSRGDVQPFVALAQGLVQAGRDVHFFAPINFESLVAMSGATHHCLNFDAEAMMQSGAGSHIMKRGENPLRLMRAMRDSIRPMLDDMMHQIMRELPGMELVIMHQILSVLCMIPCEKLGIPYMIASSSALLPSSEHPALVMPIQRNLGARLNRWTAHLAYRIYWMIFAADVQRFRREWELSRQRYRQFHAQMNAATFLAAISPSVYPPTADLHPHQHIVGYWLLHEPEWHPPQSLQDFLAAGSPPVYIGFGSMTDQNPDEMLGLVLEALRLSGQRGLLLAGWSGMKMNHLPDTVYAIQSAPHTWLFPRMSVIVHHGGASTTGAAARSGIPQIVVPFLADQPFWGKRMVDLGVAPTYIRRKTLTAENLAQAIQAAQGETYRQRAAALGEAIRHEDGVNRAVQIVEAFKK